MMRVRHERKKLVPRANSREERELGAAPKESPFYFLTPQLSEIDKYEEETSGTARSTRYRVLK
jgi:hypothetical protein